MKQKELKTINVPNDLANTIMSTEDGEEKYDQTVKQLLADRQFLVRIVKRFVTELSEYSLEEIDEKYLMREEPLISQEGVAKNTDNIIVNVGSEDKSNDEANITYDIIFRVKYPGKDGSYIGMYINLELQNKYNPGYPIEMRGVYYGARKLCSQLKVINKETDYSVLEKVYSIWICMGDDIPIKERGTATLYEFGKTDIIGTVEVPKEHYDLIKMVIVRLHDQAESEDETLNILRTVCSGLMSKQERLEALEQYGIILTDEIRTEVTNMSALRTALEKRYKVEWLDEGRAEGRAEGKTEGRAEGGAAMLVELVESKDITKETAARKFGGTYEELLAAAKAK